MREEEGERIIKKEERNKEENARTKVRNRERFLTFRTRIRVARLLLFIVAFHERTGESPSPQSLVLSSPPPPVSVPPFLRGGFSAVGRTEDTIT